MWHFLFFFFRFLVLMTDDVTLICFPLFRFAIFYTL